MTAPTKWITIFTAILGIWLLSSLAVTESPILDRWSDFVTGVVIATLSGYNYARDYRGDGPSRGVSMCLALVGAWLLFAPFINRVTGLLLWNDIVVGVLVTAFALYNLYMASLIDPRAIQNNTDGT